jgi:sugar phosphate isomerase/epimerase
VRQNRRAMELDWASTRSVLGERRCGVRRKQRGEVTEHLDSECGYDNFSRMVSSRRHFLSTIALAGAAVRSVFANPLGKPIGLQLYTVDAEMQRDFSGTLKNVAQIGIKEVEIAGLYDKSAGEWKAALKNSGLSCRSVHVYDANQSPEEVMSFASELGAKYVVTSLNPPPKITAKIAGIKDDWVPLIKAVEGMTLDDWKMSVAIANQLGEQAAKHGLAYAYHNHNVEFRKFGNTTIFEMLLTSTNPATVKFEMDCGWTSAAGYNPATFLNQYPDRICMLHIKAFQAGPPNLNLVGPKEPEPTELGRGKPDYEPIFAAAAKAKVEQYYIEQEPPFTKMSALEAVRANYNYLHAMPS